MVLRGRAGSVSETVWRGWVREEGGEAYFVGSV